MFDGIEQHVIGQVRSLLVYEDRFFDKALQDAVPRSAERYLYCLNRKKIKYKPEKIYFHADEYASFLYFLANELWLQTEEPMYAEKIYLLNRYLNSVDIFYDRKMPDIFHLEHPIGAIIGRAEIGNYFVVHQGVTVGGNLNLDLPVIGRNVVIYTGAMVIGKCTIGNDCQIGAGVILHNEDVEDGTTIVVSENQKIVKSKRDFKAHFFKTEI